MSLFGIQFSNMDTHWRVILGLICAVISNHGQVFAQVYFPYSVLRLAVSPICGDCTQTCVPGDMEPETMCFSVCNCNAHAPPAVQAKSIGNCDGSGLCNCREFSGDLRCPFEAQRICSFDDGVVCEYTNRFCIRSENLRSQRCECKDGWTGETCNVCINCDGGASSEAANNLTAMILGILLVIVVLVLLGVVILYWKKGRLPCQGDEQKKGDQVKAVNAYLVSGPIPIAEQDGTATKGPVISPPPDADTGEMEEYAYADVNQYATIGGREKSMRPAVPSAPVPSVAAAKSNDSGPYYFKLAQSLKDKNASGEKASKPAAADCYTKVVKKPKEGKPPKQLISQYDRLDRSNIKMPSDNGYNSSPSDNEYGVLSSSARAEESLP